MQGDDPKYLRVIATPKHFAVHSGPEPTRHTVDVAVSKHDMADTYLPQFRTAVVEGHAGSVMCAYNSINGQPGCAQDFLLTETLRQAWGYGRDEFGHGTHVAGIVAAEPIDESGGNVGMAPGANLINLKVLGSDGSGKTTDVIAAIEWANRNRYRYGIRIINLSLGHPVFESYKDDPLCQAVEHATAAGLVVVTAAGNSGVTTTGRPIMGGISSPGNSPFALTVGAVDDHGTPRRSDDTIPDWSSRGPTAFDHVVKPDVVAPGRNIVSLEVPGSTIARQYPERHVSGSGTHAYFRLSGTSMSAAVVSGAVALLLQANPSLTPQQVKLALELSASTLPRVGLSKKGQATSMCRRLWRSRVADRRQRLPRW